MIALASIVCGAALGCLVFIANQIGDIASSTERIKKASEQTNKILAIAVDEARRR